MQDSSTWVDLAVTFGVVAFFAFLAVMAIVALVKARRRRRDELRETPFERFADEGAPDPLDTVALAARETPAAIAVVQGPEPQVPAEPAVASAPAVIVVSAKAEREQVDEALSRGLSRTSSSLRERLAQVFSRHPKLDPSIVDALEETLLTADVGVRLTTRLLDALRADIKAARLCSVGDVQRTLVASMQAALGDSTNSGDPLAAGTTKPRVILFVGVNGVGKTTTIGKIAALARGRGQEVVLAAGDTFRAAAVEQLAIWSERTGSRLIRGADNADPAGVIFNAIEHAVAAKADLVLADTAGRLHTKTELMEEIKKVKRAAGKARVGAPDETWLVVDATTGQNALQQAREFHQALGLTGIILTKLDGTAKGGVVVAIADALHLPVRFVGVGEKPEDLRPFVAQFFVSAMFA